MSFDVTPPSGPIAPPSTAGPVPAPPPAAPIPPPPSYLPPPPSTQEVRQAVGSRGPRVRIQSTWRRAIGWILLLLAIGGFNGARLYMKEVPPDTGAAWATVVFSVFLLLGAWRLIRR